MPDHLAAYLDRIGVPDATVADLATLRRIVFAHATTIAFENLDALTGHTPDLSPAGVAAKLVTGGRGGWCFEHNLLLRGALDALGYRTTALAGRVLRGRPAAAPPPPRSHLLLLVELAAGPFVVDVGFGGLTPTGVLALRPGVEQATPHEPFRLVAEGLGYRMQAWLGDAWADLYRFDLVEQYRSDIEVANWYLSHHPDSHFVTGLRVARADPDRRYTLDNHALSIHHRDGRREQRTLAGPAQIRAVLAREFRLEVSGLPDLDAALARLPAR